MHCVEIDAAMSIAELVSRIEAGFEGRLRVGLVLQLAREAVVPLSHTVGDYYNDGDVVHILGTPPPSLR